MSEEEAVKILQYKVNNVNNDVYIGELDKQNIEAIKVLLKFIEQLQQENKSLKEELEKNTKIYLHTSKYASEMEGKYVISNYILTEFEKWLENQLIYTFTEDDMTIGYKKGLSTSLDKLQELKEGKK